jgi:hypothetical protein
MPTQVPNHSNFSPYISPWQVTGNENYPGEPIYTELAKSFMPLVGQSPLTEIFPEETIMERVVQIQQTFEAAGTLFPLVDFGKPDVVMGSSNGAVRTMYVQPLVIRRTAALSHGEMNIKLRPGTTNERWTPQEQVNKVISDMVRDHNLTWDVYRAMMLLGGISYTDPLTGSAANVSAQIPTHNLWSFDNTEGYSGRNESLVFLGLQDSNQPSPTSAGTPFTDPNADIINAMGKFNMWFSQTNKSRVTRLYMSAEMGHILASNNQVKLAMGGTAFGIPGAPAITRESPDAQFQGQFTMNEEGGLGSIAGIPISYVNTAYKDPVTGVYKKVWPVNKIVAVSQLDPNGDREAPGRTQYCASEEAGGTPGLWTRTFENTIPPAAPGMFIQMGNSGLPYLKYPYRVAHVKAASVSDVKNRQGVIGDLQFGII